ncbi:MAG: hypothetical protein ACR2QX_01045 [Woeseiaceae bacterium]
MGRQIRRLHAIRNQYDATSSTEKLGLLEYLARSPVRSPDELWRLHTVLCFIRAFPDSLAHHRLASTQLARVSQRVAALPAANRTALWDSGIAGTPVHYAFSYHVARWLRRRAPGTVSIDWDELDQVERLDELLELTLHGSEDEYYNSGWVSGREWLELARGENSDFDWLLSQLRQRRLAGIWAQAYDAANVPLTWALGNSRHSKTRNVFPPGHIAPRSSGMRRPGRIARRDIAEPLRGIELLSPRAGRKMIDVAMASLAVRHRETYHFNHANPADVHVTDVGEGVTIALFGLLPDYRFPLECTMGYLILSNGVPVGYGGSSILFRQINTGVNIFDEYRGSEAAFLWVQVMRVYHQLTGCTRFIANPYQFGAENDEALQSGAFWFYYRLGYRPVDVTVRKLAKTEWDRLSGDKNHRSTIRTLRQLASCDMHFTMPGARTSDCFDECWIETSSLLATQELTKAEGTTRSSSASALARQVAHAIGMRSTRHWTAAQRRGAELIAPFVAAVSPAAWSRSDRQSLCKVIEAKSAPSELDFARRMAQHERFLQALRKRCRQAER